MNQYAKTIIKHLDKITASGNRPSVVFQDFLDITLDTLEAMPRHVRSAVREGKFAEDTPEVAARFARLRERYTSPFYWENFSLAFLALLERAEGEEGTVEWNDTIGYVYMDWGVPNKYTGQFFTPHHVARAMGNIIAGNMEDDVYKRLEQAYLKSTVGKMHEFMVGSERVSKFVRSMGADLIPYCAEHIQPITVCDPAVGSGVMLLAVAEQTPRWALNWGLVQFWGMDIDQTCVTMCKINCMLYGLNGYNLKNALELSAIELQAIPEPYASKYAEAQANPENVESIADEIRQYKQDALL